MHGLIPDEKATVHRRGSACSRRSVDLDSSAISESLRIRKLVKVEIPGTAALGGLRVSGRLVEGKIAVSRG